MTTGIFKGIENGIMKIEYETSVKKTRIFSYPVGGDHKDVFFRGFGPREGTIGCRPDMPVVGQRVAWDGPSPDMAGHLIVDVEKVA